MKSTFSYKRSRKPPSSPDKEQQPFFPSARYASQQPFFSNAGGAIAQPKLTVSEPNSVFEQEADAVAQSVVSRPTAPDMPAPTKGQLQRQSMEEEEPQAKLMRMEEEEPQAKPELMRMEEEEPQAKPELMRMEEEEPQAKPELMRMEEEEEPQAKLMRMEEEEEPQAKPELMRMEEEEPMQAKAETGKQSPKPPLSKRIQQSKGQGQPLPAKTQKEMARAFKYDFSDVTIHTGLAAVQMTRDVQAQAFTHGKDIYFNEGKYNPDSSPGKELLAHELTHVVQQNPQ